METRKIRGFRRAALAAAGAVLAACLLLLLVGATPGDAKADRGSKQVRMNQVQVIGTHNSYHRELSAKEEAKYDELVGKPGDYQQYLAYSHATIPDQLGLQGVRGLELDLFPDPKGGLYAEPLVRKKLGLGPLPDPAWREPGIKVFHVSDLDYETTCVRFVTCLEQVRDWSSANPNHVPILVMLELKQGDPRAAAQGGVVAPPWDAKALDALDREIRSVFDEAGVITPDDVRRPSLTLEQSVLRHGWPSLEKSRGDVTFLLDNEGALNDLYAAGRPNLEGREIFTNSTPGKPDAAFLKRNDPMGANKSRIQDLVDAGYLVRTRSDLPLSTVRSGDTTMLQAALDSGAHLVSTDFPEVGMSARYGSDFVARFPDGGTVRCNPINGPRNCRDDRLEPDVHGR